MILNGFPSVVRIGSIDLTSLNVDNHSTNLYPVEQGYTRAFRGLICPKNDNFWHNVLLDDLEESTHKGYSGSTLPPKGAVGRIGPLEYCTVFDNARSGTTQLISFPLSGQ